MTAAEYRAHVGATPAKSTTRTPRINATPPTLPTTPEPPTVPATSPAEAKETGGAVAAPMRFQYRAASGLHTEQFPGYFRIVIEGPKHEQAAVEAALTQLKR